MPVKKTDCNDKSCIQQTNIALINQGMDNLSKKLDESNKIMTDFIHEIKENFVTQKEHTEVKTKLKELTDKLWNINLYVLLAIIWVVIAFNLK